MFKDSASLLFWFAAFFFNVVTLVMFSICVLFLCCFPSCLLVSSCLCVCLTNGNIGYPLHTNNGSDHGHGDRPKELASRSVSLNSPYNNFGHLHRTEGHEVHKECK
jgi:hypothetical protein